MTEPSEKRLSKVIEKSRISNIYKGRILFKDEKEEYPAGILSIKRRALRIMLEILRENVGLKKNYEIFSSTL